MQAEITKLPKVQGGGRPYATPRFEGVIDRAWMEMCKDAAAREAELLEEHQRLFGRPPRLNAAA